MRSKKTNKRRHWKNGRNVVHVTQSARSSTGQGGNSFAINASDVGVVRTDVSPRS
ncbi:hypothetical protein [Paenibacillus lentus]|uniref:hypothetical protein n=1 Tax=Paenibacillus lentus TaxID=1338368 RepID=UPI0013DE330F|nr:hypothetical protein [Paenibacillus lentus]